MKRKSNVIASVVIPAFNEEEVLFRQVEDFIRQWRDSKLGCVEIIVIENGSRDGTWREILALSKKYQEVIPLRIFRSSYGMALKRGLLAATGKFIICIDVDYFDFIYIRASLHWLHHSSGFVVGSKLHPKSIDSRGNIRLFTTRLLNTMIRLLFRYPGTDTHGLKSFSNTALFRTCVRRCVSRDELFDTELLIRLEREAVHWTEMPVLVREIRNSRSTLIKRISRAIVDFGRILLAMVLGGLARKGKLPLVADDYGWSQAHDKQILLELTHEERPAVSVLANMVTSASLRRLRDAAASGLLSVSLHFNVVEGRPISDIRTVPSLIDSSGKFYTIGVFYVRLILGLISMRQVMIELRAQYNRLCSYVTISHIDSHQHVHLLASLNRVVCLFAMKTRPGLLVRSMWSSRNYLARKPIKCVGLIMMCFVSSLFEIRLWFHNYRRKAAVSYQDELIIHPSFPYDE